jgi:hypothetical protein
VWEVFDPGVELVVGCTKGWDDACILEGWVEGEEFAAEVLGCCSVLEEGCD